MVPCRYIVSATLFALAGAAQGGDSPLAATPAQGPTTVVAMIGKEPVLAGELVDAGQASFDKLSRERAQHANVLQLRYEQAYHDLLAAQLDKRLDQRALELEAAARHVKSEVILAEIKVPIVTDAEVQALYQASKDRIGQSFDAVAGPIREYLTSQHNEQASRAFYDELRRRHGIKSLLGPYRISLAATGPVRGKSTASVTIVEFGDFQCPYCRQAESVLADLLRKYPDDVRLVFRQLPLTDLHPNAMVAAEAAVCAEQQGKFWEMHDAMYGDQDSLTAPQLTATAEHLGVDKDRFSECLKDEGQTRTELGADMEAAANIGAATTPYFLIDGRPVIGLMPEADFEKIVKEELSQPRRADRS